MDKSNLLRLFLAACLTLTFMGAAQAGQVKEKDLSDAIAPQEEKIQPAAATPAGQDSPAGEAKEGFSSGAKGLGNGFKQGAVATGHGFKWLGGKMGSGFKTTGVAMKNFFTGKYFGFGKKNEPVEEGDLKAEADGAEDGKTDLEQIQAKDKKDDDLEMDVDPKSPKGPKTSDWAG